MDETVRLETSSLAHRIIDQDDAEQLYAIYPDLPRSHMEGCPSCGKNKGPMVDGEVEINGIVYTCNCQDQLQRHKHYLDSGIGLTYQLLSWKDFVGDASALETVGRYMQNLDESVESGIGLCFFGSQYGAGKSMLGYLVLKECILRGYRCYATTYNDMLSSLKAGWKDEKYAKWYRNKVDGAQILMLDDVGKELMQTGGFNNEFSRQTLDGIIRTRVQQSRPTIITTNFDMVDIQTQYGAALFSLMTECMEPIEVKGSDFRPNVAKKPKGHRRIY